MGNHLLWQKAEQGHTNHDLNFELILFLAFILHSRTNKAIKKKIKPGQDGCQPHPTNHSSNRLHHFSHVFSVHITL